MQCLRSTIYRNRSFVKLMGDIPKPHKLEDYEPGATKKEVFAALCKTSEAKKKSKKTILPPEPASS